MPIFGSIQSPQYRLTLLAIAFILITGTALLLYRSRVVGEIEQNNRYIENMLEL